jgi:hypothetical protein
MTEFCSDKQSLTSSVRQALRRHCTTRACQLETLYRRLRQAGREACHLPRHLGASQHQTIYLKGTFGDRQPGLLRCSFHTHAVRTLPACCVPDSALYEYSDQWASTTNTVHPVSALAPGAVLCGRSNQSAQHLGARAEHSGAGCIQSGPAASGRGRMVTVCTTSQKPQQMRVCVRARGAGRVVWLGRCSTFVSGSASCPRPARPCGAAAAAGSCG